MLTKQLLLVGLLLFTIIANAQTSKTVGYPLTIISNSDKTINYIFAVDPVSLQYTENSGPTPFTQITGYVINQAKDQLDWKDYKLYVSLKSGKLLHSYTTTAVDGEYGCNYAVGPGVRHHQSFCFDTKFTIDDVNKYFLVLPDHLFPLTQ